MKRSGQPRLICFIGIDGSGKTTQARALARTLGGKGVKCRYVYNSVQTFLTRPFISIGKKLFFGGKGRHDGYKEYSNTRRGVFGNPLLSTAYRYLLLLDHTLQILARIGLPLMLGERVICDRYIHDTVVDLAADLNYSEAKVANMLRNALRLLPKPDIVFLIDVPEEIAYQRKDDIPSIDFLRERKMIYLDIGKKCNMTILDSNKPPVELENMIQNKVK